MNLRLSRVTIRRRSAEVVGSSRSFAAPVRETLALVLDENAPILDSDQDIDDVVLRLRGHLMELGHATPEPPRPAIEKAFKAARLLADIDVPTGHVQARVHLRQLAEAVNLVITELTNAGAVCGHQPECPSVENRDFQAAQVRVRHSEIGCSELCNGVLVFDDTGCLLPSGKVVDPRRPLPLVASGPKAVTS
ncbi:MULTISPECIES: DUF5999 family protein [Streptomyces]|uniref:DUF5999 family protein n=1 Tax=Streptomyces TaxID=1883 RepID=UPI0022772E0F|nr:MULTISPECIES: DUF5999 family protein [Streptomyces]